MSTALLLSAFVVSTCGLVYELITGTLASYLLGDSVTQFSTVIGTYLFGMGVGSYLSRYVNKNHLKVFVEVELLIAVVGGCSSALLFLSFDYVSNFRVLLYFIVLLIGLLVGLEIPLLMIILKDQMSFKDVVSRVLSFDYVGALVASVLFPLIFLPYFGLVRTSFFFGILNALVALWLIAALGKRFDEHQAKPLRVMCMLVLMLLVTGFVYSGQILDFAEAGVYPDRIIYSKTTPYQRIVLTHRDDSVKLYLNSHLQFDSRDEYRYHEALVHVGMQSVPSRRRVLILGGGDGFALREALKYPDVESVTLVDLDSSMTVLFRDSALLSKLNENALRSPKLHLVNADAFIWLRGMQQAFDFIIVDFPDPTNYSLGKLYTTAFYKLIMNALTDDGAVVVQSTSPLLARKSYWCVEHTISSVGMSTLPYHLYVPSFGEWGFILGSKRPLTLANQFLPGLKFISREVLPSMLFFSRDMSQVEVDVNRLNNQSLVTYYEAEWSRYS